MINISIGVQCTSAVFKNNVQKTTSFPFDWMFSNPKFVFEMLLLLLIQNISIEELVKDHFFYCDKRANISRHEHYYICDNGSALYNSKYNVIFPHDEYNIETINKYIRRFERLNEALHSNEDILFVRIYDNLEEKLIPDNYYDNILIRDEEDIQKWEDFINDIQSKYNKKIKLLIITSKEDICSKTYNNIIMHFTKEHKNPESIYNIIKDHTQSDDVL
jgi:hydroxymethylpyrimidine pyrophosphatase-like HAD family hydrolase